LAFYFHIVKDIYRLEMKKMEERIKLKGIERKKWRLAS